MRRVKAPALGPIGPRPGAFLVLLSGEEGFGSVDDGLCGLVDGLLKDFPQLVGVVVGSLGDCVSVFGGSEESGHGEALDGWCEEVGVAFADGHLGADGDHVECVALVVGDGVHECFGAFDDGGVFCDGVCVEASSELVEHVVHSVHVVGVGVFVEFHWVPLV